MNSKYSLIGAGGNIYSVFSHIGDCMRKEGFSQQEVQLWVNSIEDKAESYSQALMLCQQKINELNEKYQTRH